MGYLYTAFVIALSIIGKHYLEGRWERFKAREAQKPQQMVMRKGVYVPWGRVQKVQRVGTTLVVIWLFYMALLIGLVIYSKLVVHHSLF